METKILNSKLQDKAPGKDEITDIREYTLKQKWKWNGHLARMKENRWTKRCTEWRPRTRMFVCWLVAYRPSNMRVYLRDGSTQTILRAATLR